MGGYSEKFRHLLWTMVVNHGKNWEKDGIRDVKRERYQEAKKKEERQRKTKRK